jgi:hypothetical protein
LSFKMWYFKNSSTEGMGKGKEEVEENRREITKFGGGTPSRTWTRVARSFHGCSKRSHFWRKQEIGGLREMIGKKCKLL